jgi:hypothetical protein
MTRNSFPGTIKFLFLFILIFLCAACAIKRRYDPTNALIIDPAELPDAMINNPVTLINDQASDEETLLYTVMSVNEFYGNLHLWTEETIKALTHAIELKGGKVVKNSDKVIKVSVGEVSFEQNAIVNIVTLNVTVTYIAGSGIVKKITGSQTTIGVGPQTWPLDVATVKTIYDLLEDEEVINYINN